MKPVDLQDLAVDLHMACAGRTRVVQRRCLWPHKVGGQWLWLRKRTVVEVCYIRHDVLGWGMGILPSVAWKMQEIVTQK